jgi:hypothetical protein
MRAEVVLKDLGARENGVKMQVARKYSLAHLKVKLRGRLFMNLKIMFGKRH